MYPSRDNNHESESVALLTDHYRNKTVIPGLVRAFARQIQVAENVLWDVIEKFYLANNPVGDQLDSLGTIVGIGRQGNNDADYLALVKLQIRVNRSQGVAEDIIQVLGLAGDPNPHYTENFLPPFSGTFLAESWNLRSPVFVAMQLSHCRSVGTYGELHYSVWPDGNDFEFTSDDSVVPAEGVWGSIYEPALGGLMVAAEKI